MKGENKMNDCLFCKIINNEIPSYTIFEDDIVKDVKIIGGCPGNSLGVSMLVKDRHIDEVIDKLKDIRCGFKQTSCPKELAKGLQQYKNNNFNFTYFRK